MWNCCFIQSVNTNRYIKSTRIKLLTKASMDKETLNKWEKEHLKLLSEYPEEFEINHKIYIVTYKL